MYKNNNNKKLKFFSATLNGKKKDFGLVICKIDVIKIW